METQTLGEEIAEAKRDLKEAKARYDAAEKRNPDDPKLDRLYQGILNCQQLLHDLYEEKRLLHQEQQALRETPADMVSILEKVTEQQGEILSLPSSSNLKRTAADDGTTQEPQQQKRTKVTSSDLAVQQRRFMGTSPTLSENDWDVVPTDYWTVDMCCQWLRCAVELNEDDITSMRQWLQEDQERCHIFDLFTFVQYIPELKNIVASSSIMGINRVLKVSPPTVGPHAESLKRWAECVSRGEEKIKTVEEYNTMKHTCGKVMVLRYSDLLQSERNDKALKKLRDDVLATELRLSQLRGEEKEIDAVAAGNVLGDVEARVLPPHLSWPCFFVGKQISGAQHTHVLLRRIRQPVEKMEKDAIKSFETHKFRKSRIILWLGAAGIGKSSYTSVIAEQLVRNMNSKGNPSLVTFRIDTFLYHITCPQPGSIRVETVALRLVDDLIAISSSIAKRNGVLLMELMEKETCPSVVCHMLSSSSVKDADEVFKEQMKSGNTLIYYISPYEMWEVRAVAKLLYHLHEGEQVSELFDGDQRDSRLTCDEFVESALNRYYEVGGLPRYLFQSNDIYVSRKDDIATHSSSTDFFATLQESRPLRLTSSAKFIIAPINLSSTSWCSTVEGARIRFVYLSDICERQVIKHLSESNLNKLRVMREQFGDWLTEEVLLFASLQHHMVGTDISMFKAEWYKDPGNGKPLSSACEMDDTFVTSMQPCIRMRNIDEPICTKPVIDLEEFTIYKCTPNVNMTVADCFVVDHVNRRLWLFNNSLSLARNHPFKISNLRKITESMRIKENNYTVHLCYVRSSHRGGDVGLKFTEDGQTTKLPVDINAIYRFYVVRIHYEGIGRRVDLPNATKVKNAVDSESLIELYNTRCHESSEAIRKSELMKRNKGELVGLYTHIFPDTNGYLVDRMNKKQLVDEIDAHLHSSIRLGDAETK